MNRPVVQGNVLNYMRNGQKQLEGGLRQLQDYAKINRIPVIPHETVTFLQFIMHALAPKQVLEVGTAIGFSAALMAKSTPNTTKITTVDRYPFMIEQAKENFKALGVEKRIQLIEGQASEILPNLVAEKMIYDFIFLDCSKSKYIEFLPICLEILSEKGVIMIDDIFQGGDVFEEVEKTPNKNRRIHQGLNKLLDYINTSDSVISTILPLGDGVLLISKQNSAP